MKKMLKSILTSEGFITESCLDEMYAHLPILVVYMWDGMYPTFDYVDEENWHDSLSYFSKEECKYWMPFEKLMEDEK